MLHPIRAPVPVDDDGVQEPHEGAKHGGGKDGGKYGGKNGGKNGGK